MSVELLRGNAASAAEYIGAEILWNAESIRIERSRLRDIFDAEGLGACVTESMSATAALSRAATRTVPKDVVVRKFLGRSDAFGVYIRRPGVGEAGDDFVCGARIRLEDEGPARGKRLWAFPPEGAEDIPICYTIAEEIRDAGNALLTFAETADVTRAAIAAITGPLHGVSMRERGGVYFVPLSGFARWERLALGLAPCGFENLGFEIPKGKRQEAAASYFAAKGLESDLADLFVALRDFDPEKTRESTVNKRCADADALMAKAELYADLLGAKLAGLRNGANDAKARMRRWLTGDHGAAHVEEAAQEAADPFAFDVRAA